MTDLGPYSLDTIVVGDCLDVMKQMPDGCVDAVITDPPYGVDFHGEQWDAEIPQWLDEARRVGKSVLFTTSPTTQWTYPQPDLVACWFSPGSTAYRPGGKFNHWTPILVYGKFGAWVDVLRLPRISHTYPRGFWHPSPKPEALMLWLVENTGNPGDVIFDPFMGSGTTAVAAKKLGRHYFGCDISEEYVKLARERVAKIDGVQMPLSYTEMED